MSVSTALENFPGVVTILDPPASPQNLSANSLSSTANSYNDNSSLAFQRQCFPFEAVEKRIVVLFSPSFLQRTGLYSLRCISLQEWNSILLSTGCFILSCVSNHGTKHNNLDGKKKSVGRLVGPCTAYLLSESSLFVYDNDVVLKTCGTTVALQFVSLLFAYLGVEDVHSSVDFALFSHFSYQFPHQQSYPHRSVEEEVAFMAGLIPNVQHMTLSTGLRKDYHLMVGGAAAGRISYTGQLPNSALSAMIHLEEVIMFGVDECEGSGFKALSEEFRNIRERKRMADRYGDGCLDEFLFDPCGYSCNYLLESGSFCMLHVSPEKGVSYASFECNLSYVDTVEEIDGGCASLKSEKFVRWKGPPPGGDFLDMINHSLSTFKPRELHVLTLQFRLSSSDKYSKDGDVVAITDNKMAEDKTCCRLEILLDSNSMQRCCKYNLMDTARCTTNFLSFSHSRYCCGVDNKQPITAAPLGSLVAKSTSTAASLSLPDAGTSSIAALSPDISTDSSLLMGDFNYYYSPVYEEIRRRRRRSTAIEECLLDVTGIVKMFKKADGIVVCDERKQGGSLADGIDSTALAVNSVLMDIIKRRESSNKGCASSDVADERPIMLIDLATAYRQYERWTTNLPTVRPYYAVKCNNDPVLLELLFLLGLGFDCATQNEIELIYNIAKKHNALHRFTEQRIIYSHPCKLASHLNYAKRLGVKVIVFDNSQELFKIAQIFPDAQLLMRILADDFDSQCPMSGKFGAAQQSWLHLLKTCQMLKLDLVGISFHVGSGCRRLGAFCSTLRSARAAFDLAAKFDYKLRVLDIGGGFPGDIVIDRKQQNSNSPSFEELAAEIRESLALYFNDLDDLDVISEPGRYFASASHTLAAKVYAKCAATTPTNVINNNDDAENKNSGLIKQSGAFAPVDGNLSGNSTENFKEINFQKDAGCDLARGEKNLLYINESLYGVFNCLLYDHAVVVPEILWCRKGGNNSHGNDISEEEAAVELLPIKRTVIFGQSCDGFDCLFEDFNFQDVDIGDWLLFRSMGAYTTAASSCFNGFEKPLPHYAWFIKNY